MVAVAALAARAAGALPSAAITATCRSTRSDANSRSLLFCPAAQRYSMAAFLPSTKPACAKPLWKAARRPVFCSGEPACRTPITGIAACCACAARDHAIAVPASRVMNSRRLNCSNCIRLQPAGDPQGRLLLMARQRICQRFSQRAFGCGRARCDQLWVGSGKLPTYARIVRLALIADIGRRQLQTMRSRAFALLERNEELLVDAADARAAA